MKKRLLALVLAAILTLALVACGGTPSSVPAPSTGSSAGSVAQPSGDEPFPIEEGARLVYTPMWGESEPQGQVIKEAIEAFTVATGVEVDVLWAAGRSTRDTLETSLQSGETIDLFDEDIERVSKTWGSYLLDLQVYVDAVYPETNGSPYKDVVNNTLMNVAAELGGGMTKVIPYQPSLFVVMYNKDLFEAAGITGTPATWDEFLDVCAKLKETGIYGITVDDAYMAALFGYNMDRIIGVDATYAMAENNDFSDPGVLRFGELWEEMATEGYVSPNAASNVWPAGQTDEFAKGTVAMYLNGTWLPNELKELAPDLNWGSFAYPAIDATGDGTEANHYGSQSFGINKDTLYPNAAFALVRWLTLGEWDQKLATDTMGVPMANDATWPVQLADAKEILDTTTTRLNWAVDMESTPEINAHIKTNFALLINGTYDAQQFADAMAESPTGA